MYKIILNATYGLSNDANSFLYDPEFTMRITINGQLLLSMLYEMLAEGIPGARPLMQNTDGLEMMIPTHFKDKYLEICKDWERMTQLNLEHDEYQKMVIADVNNYIAVYKNGKVKCKGRFEWEDLDKKKVAVLHKNKSFLVIPKAIYHYFVKGILPEDYLQQNRNIYDYCAGAKAKGQWRIEDMRMVQGIPEKFKNFSEYQKMEYLSENGWEFSWGLDNWVRKDAENKEANTGVPTEYAFKATVGKEAQFKRTELSKIVRYYISNEGGKLMKTHPDGREQQLEAGRWKQTICNDMREFDENDFNSFNINEDYYLAEIYKEIGNMDRKAKKELVQLELFPFD